jgi:hypothetical protein
MTQGSSLIRERSVVVDNGGHFATQPTVEVRSNNTQLNMTPDKLIVICRRLNMTPRDADAFLTIANVNINFNNRASLLSNMTQEHFYKAFALGLSIMSWAELSGVATSASNITYNGNILESRAGFSGVGAYAPIGAPTDASTSLPDLLIRTCRQSLTFTTFIIHLCLVCL